MVTYNIGLLKVNISFCLGSVNTVSVIGFHIVYKQKVTLNVKVLFACPFNFPLTLTRRVRGKAALHS